MLVLKNKSHSITANVNVPAAGAQGVIVAQGGAFAGWSLYAHEGKPRYAYSFFGLQHFVVEGTTVIPEGDHQVRMEFDVRRWRAGQGRHGHALRRR